MKKFCCLYIFGVFCLAAGAQEALSVADYKQKVLNYNQSVQMAAQTIAAAKAAAREVKTGFFPAIDGAASYSYNFNPPSLALGAVDLSLSSRNWGVGATLQQPLYTGGHLSAVYKAAKIQQDIATYSEQLTVDNIGYTAEATYWNATAAKALLDAANNYLKIVQELYKIVEDRYNEGLISKTDLLKVATSLKDAEYQVSRAQQSYANSQIALNILAGAPADTVLLLRDSVQTVLPAPSFLSFDDVLNRRPDYQMSTKDIELERELKKSDRSQYLPKAGVGAMANYGTQPLNLNDDPLFSPILFAQLQVPIFHWAKSKQTANRYNAQIRSKELAQSNTADAINKELSIAITNILESARQITIASENFAVAAESLDLHTYSYEQGKVSLIDLQSSQLSWLQAYVNTISAQLNNKLALAEYERVVSGE